MTILNGAEAIKLSENKGCRLSNKRCTECQAQKACSIYKKYMDTQVLNILKSTPIIIIKNGSIQLERRDNHVFD